MNRMDHSDDALTAQAADWVARVHAEDAHEADWLALEAWLGEDPARLAAYDRAERLWSEIGDLSDDLSPVLAPDDAPAKVVDFTARRTWRGAPRWLGPAAGLAAAAAGVVIVLQATMSPQTLVYETAPGQTREIALADGSRIHLNGGSKIAVRLGRRERGVEMGLAEAYFDVAKDPKRPFVVDVGASEVRVLGTAFNISRTPERTTVTVARGLVEVAPESGGEAPVRLTPGHELVETAGRFRVTQANAEAAAAWRSGQLIYSGEPLSEVATDLSRRFAVPVRVEGAAASIPFSGVLTLDDQDAVISRLEAFLPIRSHRTDEAVTLIRR